MHLIDRLRTLWQQQTGEAETPFDGDAPAWVISTIFHLVFLIVVGLLWTASPPARQGLTLVAPLEDIDDDDLELPKKFYFSSKPTEEIGANSFGGLDMALAEAPNISDISEVVTPKVDTSDTGDIDIDEVIALSTGPNFSEHLAVKGGVGVGTTGAAGAIDRITYEILLSLEERRTLVVWLFDQSGSLAPQRDQIRARFDRIYKELGVIEESGHPAFANYAEKPLLTSVVAFGKTVTPRLAKPTDDLAEIKAAVAGIETDDSGIEMAFTAITEAVNEFRGYRARDSVSGQAQRNVMIVAFTDEVGDDQAALEQTVDLCKQLDVPVYVVGVPAPFGRQETLVKWIDPDPTYDQTPQWGRVNQGPETLLPERLSLYFSALPDDREPLDSGFGPYALTRLCYETGGIYFAVHPNRRVGSAVSKDETAAMSSYLKYFFDPRIMRRYRPAYLPQQEYQKMVTANKAREALVRASIMSRQGPTAAARPRFKFVRKSDADLAKELTKAYAEVAKAVPKVRAVRQMLAAGEADRADETSPRWKAGYDLAMGRALAVEARTDACAAMLDKAVRGMPFDKPGNNTWRLVPARSFDQLGELGVRIQAAADKAAVYLNRVVQEHPDTPWAMAARMELDEPWGWEWIEGYTDLTPRDRGAGHGGGGNGGGRGRGVGADGGGAARPAPKPKRAPPRL